MTTEVSNAGLEPVSCRICHREIPYAEALSIEGQEYMYFFCGSGCYEHWRQDDVERQRKSKSRGADDP
jgi:YHS domain-containing protein